nr:gamma-glutamyltransferase [Dongshaea marina]
MLLRLWVAFLVGITSIGAVARAGVPEVVPAIQESRQLYHPVWSPGGMVAAQEAVAARVGAEILKAGGNAVDAAVATGFALAVTLPKAGNLGGGGFMLVWLAKEHKAVAINYREMAPLAATHDMYLDDKGKVNRALATRHYLSSGVPGTVAGLVLAQHKYGKLTLKQVMQPAIKLAEDGIIVTRELSESIDAASGLLKQDPSSRHKFFTKEGKALPPGTLWKQPQLASTLKLIAKEGASAFYQGKIAHQIVSAMEQHGGSITLKDLKEYQAKVVPAVRGTYRGYTVLSMPPPSSGGITLVEMLNILENYDLPVIGSNNARYFHLLTEAMNYAYNDRNYYLGDPDFVDIPQQKLLSKSYASTLVKKIDASKHTPAIKISYLKPVGLESNNTTHYSVIDQAGNMVANTYTLNWSYGNGYTVPGAGFLLNNEMDDFTAKPGAANSYGLIQGEANTIAPASAP